ncbi:MAG: DNA-processing protein DprA [Spirochaetes bacterium]|jgi:DNA processing protein|nr:DNA-processing protein DprA [Spirochaetota bacterium]
MNEKLICAVTISIVSSYAMKGEWDDLTLKNPVDVCEKINSSNDFVTQEFIARIYPRDPKAAASIIIEKCVNSGVKIITLWDDDYPTFLREIYRPPAVLYVKGDLPQSDMIAVVGTRNSDARSAAVAVKISEELAGFGFTITSGMAIGIDRTAHESALDSNGDTVGVLANGIDIIYPRMNMDLFHRISSSHGSSLVSEYPPGVIYGKWTFIRRNRIISGLSIATVIIKAGDRSGALITGRYAIEQNRALFVCPGHSFDEGFAGCHRLIQNGASLVSSTEDILRELNVNFKNIQKKDNCFTDAGNSADNNIIKDQNSVDDNDEKIMRILSGAGGDVDWIIRNSGLSAREVNKSIMMLELQGRISRNGNMISRKL